MLYFRNHRLTGLEDSSEIAHSINGHQPGGTGNHTGDPGGIVKVSERLKGTMNFSIIKLYRSTTVSILFAWGWN